MVTREHVPDPGAISVKRHTDGAWVIVVVLGDLDMATAPLLRGALHPDALLGGRRHVVLDLAGLTFCDSSGLGVLVGAHKRLRQEGGQLMLQHVPEFLARRLKCTGADRLIPSDMFLDTIEGLENQ